MPSPFEQSFAGDSGDLYMEFGLPATYTSPAGETTTTGLDGNPLVVRVQRGPVRQAEIPNRNDNEIQSGELLVRMSQIAAVVKDSTFEVEGVEIWRVEMTPIRKNGQHYCTCQRTGTHRKMTMGGKK